jgi:hypothetical protein
MIVFTSDIDWAPEEVINDTIKIFENFNVKCTFFGTHKSKILDECDRNLFELGVHPNFNPSLINGVGKKAVDIIDDIISIFPEAKGVRSHSTTSSSGLLDIFKRKGLLYESNQLLPYNWNIKPYDCWSGLKRIPYNWEDDTHFLYGKKYDYDILKDYDSESLIILDFHPIHVYLNTDCQITYDNAKIHYQSPEKLLDHRNNKNKGVRDFLLSTLKQIEERNITTYKMVEIIN